MYQKYQTDALILGSRESGEADKTYAIYTRDFGLVRARASSIRREKSLMRFALQNYAHANVSLVRGKKGWRAAGARAIEGIEVHKSMAAATAFARIAELVMRLVIGEDKNEYLFETLVGAHAALREGRDPEAVEILCVARALYALGYLSNESFDPILFEHSDFSNEDIEVVTTRRAELLASINHALSQTQLVR